MPTRLAVLLLGFAAHATLAKIMYGYGFPRGAMTGPEEIQVAAQWMYYGGDIAELMLAATFFATWFRSRRLRP